MLFHLINLIKEIFYIIVFIIFGIFLFEISLQIKFKAEDLSVTIGLLAAIIIVIILYLIYIKSIKSCKMLNIKYLRPIPLMWKTKYLILIFGLIIQFMLENILPSSVKSCNQATIEKDEVNLYNSLLESGMTAPIIEEIMFRGILFIIILTASNYLFKRNNRNFDVLGIGTFFVFSSVFFGYVHVAKCSDIENIGGYLASGIAFTLVFLITRDIKIPIILHMLTNITSVLNRNDYKVITEVIDITMVIIFLIIFSRVALIRKSKTRKDIKNQLYYISYSLNKYEYKRRVKKERKVRRK